MESQDSHIADGSSNPVLLGRDGRFLSIRRPASSRHQCGQGRLSIPSVSEQFGDLHDLARQQTEHQGAQAATELNTGLEMLIQRGVVGGLEVKLQGPVNPVGRSHVQAV